MWFRIPLFATYYANPKKLARKRESPEHSLMPQSHRKALTRVFVHFLGFHDRSSRKISSLVAEKGRAEQKLI